MIRTTTIGDLRQQVLPLLRLHGVSRAAVFGSVARGEDQEGSDVDLVVEFEEGRTLLDLVGLRQDLQELLGREADVATYDSLHPRLRERVLEEQVPLL